MTEELETTEVVSIKFRNRGKMYFFDPAGQTLQKGAQVVVETSKGLELGNVIQGNHLVSTDRVVQPLRPVVRCADEDDLAVAEQLRQKEKEAFVICKQKIEDHGLEMKLVDVECSFEGNKILFFFSSDGRVDFRELVKDLASVFRTRIELRQIGVRDEARMLGGLGICGRTFCCSTFMDEFQPVSTKMAKTQSMSLNPAKISGCCGRLMCCLRYEQPAYEELVKSVPKNGAFVETPDGYGNVTQVNVLRQTVRVKLDGFGEDPNRLYEAEDVATVPGGRPKDGSTPPHVLVIRPKKPKVVEKPEYDWEMPERLITAPEPQGKRTERGPKRTSKDRSKTDRGNASTQDRGKKNTQDRQYKPRPPKQGRSPNEQRSQNEKNAKPSNQGQRSHDQQPRQPQSGGDKKKYNPNHRRNYRPRPKPSGEDGGRKEGGD